jgi:hypothetical protein
MMVGFVATEVYLGGFWITGPGLGLHLIVDSLYVGPPAAFDQNQSLDGMRGAPAPPPTLPQAATAHALGPGGPRATRTTTSL